MTVDRFKNRRISKNVKDWSVVTETEENSKKLLEDSVTQIDGYRSILIFGPPGTAKTTMVKGVAFTLNRKKMCSKQAGENEPWPCLTINPADLVGSGTHGDILDNARRTLNHIRRLSEVVVLFDEAENLVWARDDPRERRMDRMITAAMLPMLSDIDKSEIKFFLATNHIDQVDIAIRRRGRFQLRLGIGPPGKEERRNFLSTNDELGFQNENFDEQHWQDLFSLEKPLTVKEIIDLAKKVKEDSDPDSVKSLLEKAKANSELSVNLPNGSGEITLYRKYLEDRKIYHDGDQPENEYDRDPE